MRHPTLALIAAALAPAALAQPSAFLPAGVAPDIVVAADGSGNFATVEAAVASVPKDNRDRVVILVKNGTYHEKVRIDASDVTLLGESRDGVRIEFAQRADAYRRNSDKLGTAVVNVNGDDVVLQNLTIDNTQPTIGTHAFAVYGRGDRTVITDANIWSNGNDTLSLWRATGSQFGADAGQHVSPNGRYYHARLDVKGSVDFICPRGWCYLTDSTIHELKAEDAAVWHDGSRDKNMKFVMTDCRFDGIQDWRLARHHHDGQFYFIGCTFSSTLEDRAPYRVIYPLDGGKPTPADIRNNQEHDATNIWGERSYFYHSHRTGGDYAWMRDNLEAAPGSPRPGQITAAWTFDGSWDPEAKAGPSVRSVGERGGRLALTFSEPVTVKGHPRVDLGSDEYAEYASGSGTDTLVFAVPAGRSPRGLVLNGGAIVATEAAASLRPASLELPRG
ncbi:MAG TPA: pectinesterase family protein [Opitutaceae bacterium]|nr:pectinesterase family protein [Opitutaceae bacterium]